MAVYKTGTGWGYVVDLPRGRDGQRRQRRGQGFPTKKAAMAEYRQLAGRKHVPDAVTVDRLAGKWLAVIEADSDIQGSTVHTHRANLTHYILPAIGHIDADDVTAYDLEMIYAHARKQGVRGRPLSARSVETIHQTCSAMFKRGIRWGDIDSDPTVQAQRPKVVYDEKRSWTADEVRQFLATISARDDFALWYLAVITGARVGELAALTWDRIDFEAGTVRFTEAEKVRDSEGRLFPSEPEQVSADVLREWGKLGPVKTRRARTVYLDAGTVAVLDGWKVRQDGWRDEWEWPDHVDWVWTFPTGRRYKKAWIGKKLKALIPEGVESINFHEIRHTAATLMLQAGVDPATAADRLGHDKAMLLSTYAHALDESKRQAAATMGQLVSHDVTRRTA